MHVHIHHHIEFDEGSPFVKLVKGVDQNVRLLLHRTLNIMAQLDDLMAALNAISGDVDSTLGEVKMLEEQLQVLQNNTPPTVDLQPALDAAASIRQRLEGTVNTAIDATNTPADQQPGDAQPTADAGEATTSPSVDSSEAASGDGSAGTGE